jgi:hypothetical protein
VLTVQELMLAAWLDVKKKYQVPVFRSALQKLYQHMMFGFHIIDT